MGTSASFVPAAAPECAYAPRMTRAAALALRAAGTLQENCVVVITDGPVIGTAGNTSPTEIELNPVSPTELGTTARVHTTFAASAWEGAYDIDLGTAGSITRLVDDFGNDVRDPDADAPTVHTQFPWHRGGSTVRDNYIEDATLIGWDATTAGISRNRIVNATVDLSGDWTFNDNTVTDAGSAVTLIQSVTGRNFLRNIVKGGAVFRALGGSSLISDSQFLDGYVTEIAAGSTASVTIDGSKFSGHFAPALDLQIDGSGPRNFNDCDSVAHGNQTQYVLLGGGTGVGLTSCVMTGARLVRDPATTATLSLSQVRGTGAIVQGAGATGGSLTLNSSTIEVLGTVITQNGPGAITSNSSKLAANISNSAAATRALSLVGCDLVGGVLTQNRTGGAGIDTIQNLTLRSALSNVTLNGAVDPSGNQTPINYVTVESGATLALTDPVGTAGVCMQQCHLSSAAQVSGTGTGLVNGCRFSAGPTVNLGAFAHDRSIVDGALTVTATAGNSNRLANKAFSDWV